MKKANSLFFYLLLSILFFGCGGKNTPVTVVRNGAIIESGKQHLKIVFYKPDIARITKWQGDKNTLEPSLSVIADSTQDVPLKIKETDDSLFLETTDLIIKVYKVNCQLAYFNKGNECLLSEIGSAAFKPVVYNGDSGFTVRQQFRFSEDEGIYGLGQHQNGFFNYRGRTVKLVQANTEAVSPFFISTGNYGILWDNYSRTLFSDNEDGGMMESDMGDNIDYYFIGGGSMDEVIAGYRYLTGPAPLYGKWAYGYWQSREHYDTQAELMQVAEKYRRLKIPIDNMIQDWDYWNGAANWGGMFFDRTLFPTPEAMCDRLHRLNFHIIISIWPAMGPKTAIYSDMLNRGFLYKPVGWAGFKYYDAFNPAANRLYWQYLKSGLYSKGLDGWWIDSTEPDVINALTKESTEYELKKMGGNFRGSWARYLNAFSLVMTDDIYKFWREETSARRAYILTRSTFAGQQRNAATTWSGDIGASWEIYRDQITAGINHSMSGIPYWTFDIGSFVLGAYGGVFTGGGKDPAYQELYTRMFQFGAFAPIFRSHGSETPREIWEMGEYADEIRLFDDLRYRLMPYIYSLAWKVTSEGYTIMRGLPMDFPADKNTRSVGDQYMFGPAILVCPVTSYMEHRPPENSVFIGGKFFRTRDGKPGLTATYYKDDHYRNKGLETIDTTVNVFWYTGRPAYVSDSMFSIRWTGKLIPEESGGHQFHLKSFDAKRIILDGDTLPIVYTSVEQYTAVVELKAGQQYDFVLETENRSTGAARMQLYWKTPSVFRREKMHEERDKTREVYLPAGTVWFDFWTGKSMEGGRRMKFEAGMDKIPLLVRAGSIIPMGPFLQYATEKPADPLEIRIYPGNDGEFVLYEDENDNYNYEKGNYSIVAFSWHDKERKLTIGERKGEFPGMLKNRVMNIVLVGENRGSGVGIYPHADRVVKYDGRYQEIAF